MSDRIHVAVIDDHPLFREGVAHTIRSSKSLEVVAEGVEKEEQLAFLKSKSCNDVQGFLFSKPLPAKELTYFLHKPFAFTESKDS